MGGELPGPEASPSGQQQLPGPEARGWLRKHLVHETVIAPEEWKERYSVQHGAVFGEEGSKGNL